MYIYIYIYMSSRKCGYVTNSKPDDILPAKSLTD